MMMCFRSSLKNIKEPHKICIASDLVMIIDSEGVKDVYSYLYQGAF